MSDAASPMRRPLRPESPRTHGRSRHPLRAAALCAAGCLPLLFNAAPAWARAYHTEPVDELIARCSTVNTTTLPRQSLERYGVASDPQRGLLSCLVQQKAGMEPENRRAEVEAEFAAIGQTPEAIEMREILDGDLITYIGTYVVPSDHPLSFTVVMSVSDGPRVDMSFEDREPQI